MRDLLYRTLTGGVGSARFVIRRRASAKVFSLMTTRCGKPSRSESANFSPGRASRSSYKTSIPFSVSALYSFVASSATLPALSAIAMNARGTAPQSLATQYRRRQRGLLRWCPSVVLGQYHSFPSTTFASRLSHSKSGAQSGSEKRVPRLKIFPTSTAFSRQAPRASDQDRRAPHQ